MKRCRAKKTRIRVLSKELTASGDVDEIRENLIWLGGLNDVAVHPQLQMLSDRVVLVPPRYVVVEPTNRGDRLARGGGRIPAGVLDASDVQQSEKELELRLLACPLVDRIAQLLAAA